MCTTTGDWTEILTEATEMYLGKRSCFKLTLCMDVVLWVKRNSPHIIRTCTLLHTGGVEGHTHCCRDVRLLLVKSMIPPTGFKRSPAVPRPIPFMMPTAPSSLPPDGQAQVISWDITTIIQVWIKYEPFYWGCNVHELTYAHNSQG